MRSLVLTSAILLVLNGCDSSGSDSNLMAEDRSEVQSEVQSEGQSEAQSDSSEGILDANTIDGANVEPDLISTNQTINSTNYANLTRDVVNILNLHTIDEIRLAARDRARQVTQNNDEVLAGNPPSLPGLSLASQTPIEGDEQSFPVINEMVFACENAGTLNSLDFHYGDAPYTVRDVAYDNCLFNNVNSEGRYTFTAGRRTNTVDTFTNYQVESDGIKHSASGTWEYTYPWFGDNNKQYWTGASFSQSDANASLIINDFDWSNEGIDSGVPKHESLKGFVVDAEGIVRPVQLVTYQARFTSGFTLISDVTNKQPVRVAAELQFKRDYFVWREDNVGDNTALPDYPVSDLGSPLTLSSDADFDNAGMIMLIDQQPQDRDAQWQTGELRLIAEDGSKMVLRPNANDKTQVHIQLANQNGPITALWSEGYQIDCVSIMEGCGRDVPRIR